MLTIRLQRTGRSGYASFRVLVQDSRWSPKSGKFVAHLGSYDPHTKTTILSKEKAEFYLKNGARPSERVAKLLKEEGIKLPRWVKPPIKKVGKTKNPEKLRKNQPKEIKPDAATKQAIEKPEKTETETKDMQPELTEPETVAETSESPDQDSIKQSEVTKTTAESEAAQS